MYIIIIFSWARDTDYPILIYELFLFECMVKKNEKRIIYQRDEDASNCGNVLRIWKNIQ